MRLRPPKSPIRRTNKRAHQQETDPATPNTSSSSSKTILEFENNPDIVVARRSSLKNPGSFFRRRSSQKNLNNHRSVDPFLPQAVPVKQFHPSSTFPTIRKRATELVVETRQPEQKQDKLYPGTSSGDSSSNSSSSSSSSRSSSSSASSSRSADMSKHEDRQRHRAVEDLPRSRSRSHSPFWNMGRKKSASQLVEEIRHKEQHEYQLQAMRRVKELKKKKGQRLRNELIDYKSRRGGEDEGSVFEVVLATAQNESSSSPMRKLIRSLSPARNKLQIYSDPINEEDEEDVQINWPSFFATISPKSVGPRSVGKESIQANHENNTRSRRIIDPIMCILPSTNISEQQELDRSHSLIDCDYGSTAVSDWNEPTTVGGLSGLDSVQHDLNARAISPEAVLEALLQVANKLDVTQDSEDLTGLLDDDETEFDDEHSDTSSFAHWVAERERKRGTLGNMMDLFDFKYLFKDEDDLLDETTLFTLDTTKGPQIQDPIPVKKAKEAKKIHTLEALCSPGQKGTLIEPPMPEFSREAIETVIRKTERKTKARKVFMLKNPPAATSKQTPQQAATPKKEVSKDPPTVSAKQKQSKRDVKEAMKKKAARMEAEQQRLDEVEMIARLQAAQREQERLRLEARKQAEQEMLAKKVAEQRMEAKKELERRIEAEKEAELQRILSLRQYPRERKRDDSHHRLIEKEVLRQHRIDMEKRSPTTVKSYVNEQRMENAYIPSRQSLNRNTSLLGSSNSFAEDAMHKRIHEMPHPNSLRHTPRGASRPTRATIETFPPRTPLDPVPMYRVHSDFSVGSIDSQLFQFPPVRQAKKDKVSEKSMSYTKKLRERTREQGLRQEANTYRRLTRLDSRHKLTTKLMDKNV